MATTDPFTNIVGTIQPLTVGTSENEYSIKLTTQKTSSSKQIHNYLGSFDPASDSSINAMGLQSQVMVALETAIQDLYSPEYAIGDLPTLGRPGGINFLSGDIVVSFAQRGDYFVFSGTGAGRMVYFISVGSDPVSWQPETDMTPPLNPENHTITYPTVTYDTLGNISITDSIGRVLRFDSSNKDYGIVGSEISLSPTTNTYSITYVISGTDVGATKITSMPSNPNDIDFAQYVEGQFYDTTGKTVSSTYTYTDLYNRLTLNQPGLTVGQQNCINRLCRTIYNPVKNAVKYLMGMGSFGSSTGYASFVSVNGMSLEIRAT